MRLKKEIRLGFEHNRLFQEYKKATFCTYSEMREMLSCGLIKIASHTHTHTNLLENVVLDDELLLSKKILEEKLDIQVESFVFPFGKYNNVIAKECKKHYKYMFRIGNAIHKDFSGIDGIIYRVDGDNLKTYNEIFRIKNILRYRLKALSKKIIGSKK